MTELDPEDRQQEYVLKFQNLVRLLEKYSLNGDEVGFDLVLDNFEYFIKQYRKFKKQ